MAGRTKNISQMLGDIQQGDRVRFETTRLSAKIPEELETHSGYATGYCLDNLSPNNKKGKWYRFSREKDGPSDFTVCPTNRRRQLKAPDDVFRVINNYKIISRAKAPSAQPQRTMPYIGLTFL